MAGETVRVTIVITYIVCYVLTFSSCMMHECVRFFSVVLVVVCRRLVHLAKVNKLIKVGRMLIITSTRQCMQCQNVVKTGLIYIGS